MSLHFDRNLALAGIIISLVIFIGHYGLPEKRLVLYPSKLHMPNLFGFVDTKNGQSSYWLDDEKKEWICNYRTHHLYGCGWSLKWESPDVNSIDMRAYDYIDISLDYEGPASRLRLILRNYDAAYSVTEESASTKFMSMTVPAAELVQPVRVSLDEFYVASWWLLENNIRRDWSLPEFDGITSIGVDFIEPGEHRTRVNKVVLIGQWIKTETLLLAIIGFWMTVFLIDGFVRFCCHYTMAKHERSRIRTLEETRRKLEAEKRDLKIIADTDPLTGVLSRGGLQTHIAVLFRKNSSVSKLGLMLLDIDHFKNLNDTHGYDMGDKVLRAFAAAVSANLRSEDVFGRWEGEKFVVLCQNKSESDLISFAEKLREITAKYTFGYSVELTITVSIGITMAQIDRGFDEAFRRADAALYRAKNRGRNRVEIEL